jgi:hypothetical protein
MIHAFGSFWRRKPIRRCLYDSYAHPEYAGTASADGASEGSVYRIFLPEL